MWCRGSQKFIIGSRVIVTWECMGVWYIMGQNSYKKLKE
jgi:hypothetical protein